MEIVTDGTCWIFTYNSITLDLDQAPFYVGGAGVKVSYPDNMTIVYCESETEANAKIKELNLIDLR